MTPTFRVVGDQLQEQPRMAPPPEDYTPVNQQESAELQDWLECYQTHIKSLRVYTIRPSDWEGITEVNEGEFLTQYQVLVAKDQWEDCHDLMYNRFPQDKKRILAVPLRPAGKGQEAFSLRWSREQFDNNQTKYYHQRAKWISSCIESGFADKDQIEALEKIWDDFKKPL